MPQYRKLHTRTIESFDFNGLTDDFSRLTWVLLPLVSCKDGRGIDLPGWLIAKLYPMRQDITPAMIDEAMADFERHGMLTRYAIDGRRYYQITNWTKYQGDTKKEGDSPYPPQIEVGSRSGVGTEQVGSESRLYSDADADADAYSDAPAPAVPTPAKVKRTKNNPESEPQTEPGFSELQEHFVSLTTIQPNHFAAAYERDWKEPLERFLLLTAGDVPRAKELIANALHVARGSNGIRKVYPVASPRSIATIAANLIIESGAAADEVVADTLWKQVRAALVNGYATAEPRLQKAMQTVGWGKLKEAKEKDVPQLRDEVFHAYRNTIPV